MRRASLTGSRCEHTFHWKGKKYCCWVGFNIFPFYFCPTGPAANAPKQEPGTGDAPPAGEEEEKKKQKRGTLANNRRKIVGLSF